MRFFSNPANRRILLFDITFRIYCIITWITIVFAILRKVFWFRIYVNIVLRRYAKFIKQITLLIIFGLAFCLLLLLRVFLKKSRDCFLKDQYWVGVDLSVLRSYLPCRRKKETIWNHVVLSYNGIVKPFTIWCYHSDCEP